MYPAQSWHWLAIPWFILALPDAGAAANVYTLHKFTGGQYAWSGVTQIAGGDYVAGASSGPIALTNLGGTASSGSVFAVTP